jgi:hypothetical protein
VGRAIDTAFDVYSDTPPGRDPDSRSATLRSFHQRLWSKPLPDGGRFQLSADHPGPYLRSVSQHGEVDLSSDSLGHTYQTFRAMAPIVAQIPAAELAAFFAICSTIGAYVVFPSRRIDGKPTINGARGMHPRIKDRFDLTLECIRLHYLDQDSPLGSTMARYHAFFRLFGDFKGYVEFFLFQDLVSESRDRVNFFLPFSDFQTPALPAAPDAYRCYAKALSRFIRARNARIAAETVLAC